MDYTEKELFHFTKSLNLGDTLDTHLFEYNNYYKKINQFSTLRLESIEQGMVYPVEILLNLFHNSNYYKYHTPDNPLYKKYKELRCYIDFSREQIFESIRSTNFSDKPSRQKCIWLTETLDEMREWSKIYKEHEKDNAKYHKIVKVYAKGNFHTTFSNHITYDITNIRQLEKHSKEQAFSYWKGNPPKINYGFKETLFEGTIKVIEAMKL